ncbi:protein kinase, partial [Klebsiella pneumoniae]
LRNGAVAVKKLSQTLYIHEKKFQQEVASLMRMKHKNIVRFLGYCSDTQEKTSDYNNNNAMLNERERLLCLEFLPRGSLDKYGWSYLGTCRKPEMIKKTS